MEGRATLGFLNPHWSGLDDYPAIRVWSPVYQRKRASWPVSGAPPMMRMFAQVAHGDRSVVVAAVMGSLVDVNAVRDPEWDLMSWAMRAWASPGSKPLRSQFLM
jgi:hypothetical protein